MDRKEWTKVYASLGSAFRDMGHATRGLFEAVGKIDLGGETEEIMKRMRAAKERPDDPKSKIFETAIGPLTPLEASLFWRYLPDPLKRRGRRKGSGELNSDDQFFEEMARRIEKDGRPAKSVAREIIEEQSDPLHSEVESRANYMARLYRQRVKK